MLENSFVRGLALTLDRTVLRIFLENEIIFAEEGYSGDCLLVPATADSNRPTRRPNAPVQTPLSGRIWRRRNPGVNHG
jgi:hypothetical protein